MVKFYCNYCRYKFESKKESTPAICPFCSKERTLVREMDAASLIRDVSGIE